MARLIGPRYQCECLPWKKPYQCPNTARHTVAGVGVCERHYQHLMYRRNVTERLKGYGWPVGHPLTSYRGLQRYLDFSLAVTEPTVRYPNGQG